MFIEEPRTEGVCLSGSRAWFVRIYDRERDLLPAAARGGGDLGGGQWKELMVLISCQVK